MNAPAFQFRPHRAAPGVLEVFRTDAAQWVETTDAPARIVADVIAEAREDWRACDIVGFAEARTRRNIAPTKRNPRTLAPVAQKDLFAVDL